MAEPCREGLTKLVSMQLGPEQVEGALGVAKRTRGPHRIGAAAASTPIVLVAAAQGTGVAAVDMGNVG